MFLFFFLSLGEVRAYYDTPVLFLLDFLLQRIEFPFEDGR